MGHLQVVTGLSDQLYRNAWSVLGEFCGRGASRDIIITVGTMARDFFPGVDANTTHHIKLIRNNSKVTTGLLYFSTLAR